MKIVSLFLAVTLLALGTGCSNTASKDYYLAMQQAAQANAAQQEARYRALATVAQNGDPASKAAATMAIALTQDKVITPQYVEDPTLKWASVLAAPVAAVAGLAIQADVAKNASDNSARVQLASFQSNENIQLGQQQMLVDALGTSSSGTADAVNGVVNLGVAGFEALNIAGDQTAGVALAGFDSNEAIAVSGFTTLDSVATTGFTTLDSVATTGLNTSENISLGAQTSLVTLGTAGLAATQGVANTGLDNLNVLGQSGFTNLVDLGETSLTTLENITTDYNTLLQDYNTVMQTIATDNPDVCVADPVTGTVTCN